MIFWDSSAILPLIVEEKESAAAASLLTTNTELWVWWGTMVECKAAIARRTREGSITPEDRQSAFQFLEELSLNWHEIQPSTLVRNIAVRLVSIHSVRAADSFQLAAALATCSQEPQGHTFYTFDRRLREVAGIEGFLL